jgi:AraC family transcriptional regulator
MSHLQSRVRYRGQLVSIIDVCCRPFTPRPSNEEHVANHEVVFPRTGVFVKHVGHDKAVADPNHVLFFNANEPYRVSHPAPGGDDCTVYVFSPETLIEALAHYEPRARDHPEKPFAVTHGAVELRTILRQQQIRSRLNGPATADLLIEESALHLLHDVVRNSYKYPTGSSPRRHWRGTLRLRREWIDAVKLLLAKRPEANISLTEIGRAVHCSPFHLARLFRVSVGLSIHQYQICLRLALALDRLANRSTSLTELALDLGFSSHSHFTAAFQRSFGTSPSSFRRTATGSRLRKLSKILKV